MLSQLENLDKVAAEHVLSGANCDAVASLALHYAMTSLGVPAEAPLSRRQSDYMSVLEDTIIRHIDQGLCAGQSVGTVARGLQEAIDGLAETFKLTAARSEQIEAPHVH